MAARVITIAQQKGGAGKTTLAAHLALAWHDRGEKVALVDIDPQGTLSHWFALREAQMGKGKTGVDLTQITGWRAGAEIDRLKRDYSLVVVDSPPHAQTDAKIAVRAANLVVIPVQPSPLDVWATRPTVELATAEKVRVLLVMNRVPSRSLLTGDMVAALGEINAELATARLGNRGSLAMSMAAGLGVAEHAPGTIAAREVAKVAREVLSRIGE
ncbi:MAG TPA: ParA family partition ATPase [Aliidongia sp.]|nr:ParA family partition ATPase [Aliidongia sp.]